MGQTKAEYENARISQSDGAVGDDKPPAPPSQAQPQGKIRSGSTKPRRPDRAVYVPRALRTADSSTDDSKPSDSKRIGLSVDTSKCTKPQNSNDKPTHGTPRKSLDRNFCNVYKPPHLRSQRSQIAPSIDHATVNDATESVPSSCQVPNSDNRTTLSDCYFNDIEVGENFYIGDYFTNGQLGFYAPPYYSEFVNRSSVGWQTNEPEGNMAVNETNQQNNIIDKEYMFDKDEDFEKNELKRASQEINRSSKRIIKQSFDSDVLVISDPVEEPRSAIVDTPSTKDEVQLEVRNTKPKLEPKVSLKREENDWEAVFDDSGECLDPSLLEELTSTVGKVHINKTKNNYEQYQTRAQTLFNGPYDETFAHVIEVYDFPSEFKTNDLLSLFSEYKDTGFEIKWVDDTHALIVFSSAKIAAEVLSTQRPLVRCRPLHAATLESRNKAKKCAEFLQPYRQRPETCTALARRLVSGALGVRLSTARQERAEERRLITIAREKKRQAALHKEAAWDGSLTNQSMSES